MSLPWPTKRLSPDIHKMHSFWSSIVDMLRFSFMYTRPQMYSNPTFQTFGPLFICVCRGFNIPYRRSPKVPLYVHVPWSSSDTDSKLV